MDIVYVNSTRKWGGVKTWTLDTASWLAARGHGVHIVCRPGIFAERARDLGLDVLALRFGIDFNPLLVPRFAAMFRRRGTDVLVCNVAKDLRTAGLAARLVGVPVLHRVGLPRDMRDTPKVRLVHRFVSPRILVPSADTREGLLQALPFLDPAGVEVILTGKRPSPEPPTPTASPLRMTVSSRLDRGKGHDELLRVLAELAAEGRDFRLTILGTGSEEDSLRDLADELGLTERVRFTGFVSDVRARLSEADVFVLPSRSEGLPNTLLEAMAEGLAPVARDVGGVREVWPEDLEGLLFADPADSQAGKPSLPTMKQALERVLGASHDEILTWKRRALEQCRTRFSLDSQARAFERLLLDIRTANTDT